MLYTADMDLTLLELISDEEPWRASYGKAKETWEKITFELQNVYKDAPLFSSTGIQKRFKHLLSVQNSSESKNRFRSGIYEEYSEHSKLLIQINQKINFFEKSDSKLYNEKENEIELVSDISDKLV